MRILRLIGTPFVAICLVGCLHGRKNANDLFSPLPGTETTPAPQVAASTNVPGGQLPATTNFTVVAPQPAQPLPQTDAKPVKTVPARTAPIVTPAEGLAGKVVTINSVGKFVVLSFPLGQMPAFDQQLNVYRRGLKVGELKVTGPKLEETIAADIAQGTADVGDDVRDR